jgi:glycosyltransferase involved in cell wall biosynthesis
MKLSINGRFLLQDVTGVQRVAIEFVRALDKLIGEGAFPGLDATLLVPRNGTLVTELALRSVLFRREGRLTGHAWEQLELPGLAGKSALLCLGNTAPVARLLRASNPTYTVVHDLSYRYFPAAYTRSFRLLYNTVIPLVLARSTHVFTVSASEEESMLRHYPRLLDPDRLTAVQNGGGERAVGMQISSEPSSLQPGAPAVPTKQLRAPTCLYVGSLTKRKNGEGLIRAAVKLVDGKEVNFVVVGSAGSPFKQFSLEVLERVRNNIKFLGQVNDPHCLEDLYRHASVFVFPSLYEASPLSPVEAMSLGCPVACSDIPSLRERCGDAAAYFDPNDSESIVRTVTDILSDEARWRDMQHRGLAQASMFSWERQVKAVLNVLASA